MGPLSPFRRPDGVGHCVLQINSLASRLIPVPEVSWFASQKLSSTENSEEPAEKVDLSANKWLTARIRFKGDIVDMAVDNVWDRQLKRPNFNDTKGKLFWMQNGGERGIEIDDGVVSPTR